MDSEVDQQSLIETATSPNLPTRRSDPDEEHGAVGTMTRTVLIDGGLSYLQ